MDRRRRTPAPSLTAVGAITSTTERSLAMEGFYGRSAAPQRHMRGPVSGRAGPHHPERDGPARPDDLDLLALLAAEEGARDRRRRRQEAVRGVRLVRPDDPPRGARAGGVLHGDPGAERDPSLGRGVGGEHGQRRERRLDERGAPAERVRHLRLCAVALLAEAGQLGAQRRVPFRRHPPNLAGREPRRRPHGRRRLGCLLARERLRHGSS